MLVQTRVSRRQQARAVASTAVPELPERQEDRHAGAAGDSLVQAGAEGEVQEKRRRQTVLSDSPASRSGSGVVELAGLQAAYDTESGFLFRKRSRLAMKRAALFRKRKPSCQVRMTAASSGSRSAVRDRGLFRTRKRLGHGRERPLFRKSRSACHENERRYFRKISGCGREKTESFHGVSRSS